MNLSLPSGIDPTVIILVAPLIVLQLGLVIAAVIDLLRDDRRVRGGNKGVWAVIIVFVNLIGPIVYFIAGREDGVPDEPTGPGVPGYGSPHDPPVAGSTDPRGGAAADAGAWTAPGAAAAWTAPPGRRGSAPAPAWTPPSDPRRAGPSDADRAALDAGSTNAPASALPIAFRAEAVPAVPAAAVAPAIDLAALAPAAGPAAIATEGLTRRYPGGVLALDGLSMTVPAGSVFGLLGPNGAGKTTTLRLLAGLTRPTSGRAVVNGITVADDPLAVRRGLGYLEQDPRAYGWMTGREQVTMLARLHGLDGEAGRAAVDAALRRVDLLPAADRRTATYSGGMRQRLGIAGALVHRPPVVVLDEPASALDPEGRRDVLELIASLRGEATVLFSTHVLADVERICDRVGILDHGHLVVEGPLAALLDRYALPVYRVEAEPGQAAGLERLAARLRDADWVTGAAVDHGLLTVAVADPARAARELLPAITAEDIAVVSVARARPTLEDVFLRLTGGSGEVAA